MSDNIDTQNRTRHKKAMILAEEPQSKKGLTALVVLTVALAGGLGFYFSGSRQARDQPVAHDQGINVTPEAVTYPLTLFDDGQARHYDHQVADLTVRYFILKSSDGVIRAAFDACDVCWPEAKGYAQKGDVMVCRNCGQQFASLKINEIKGGCNPAPLERNIQGDRLVIRTADIAKGRAYFDFKGKG